MIKLTSLSLADDRSNPFRGSAPTVKGRDTLGTAILKMLRRRGDVHFVCVGLADRGLDVPAD